MGKFTAELELSEALGLFLVLRDHADDERVSNLITSLRIYLYEHLSIEEMEEPELFYKQLQGSSREPNRSGAIRPCSPASRAKR